MHIPCCGCGAMLAVDDHLAGRVVRCPRCQETTKVPDVAEGFPTATAPPPQPEPDIARSVQPSSATSPWDRPEPAAARDDNKDEFLDRGYAEPDEDADRLRRRSRRGTRPTGAQRVAFVCFFGVLIVVGGVAVYYLWPMIFLPLGNKVQHGDIEVYYTEGADQAEANRLGQYLQGAWGAPAPGVPGGKRTVQLKKTADGYQLRMVVKPEFRNDARRLQALAFEGARVSSAVFAGAAVEVHACDEYMKTLKAIPPRADVRFLVAEGKVEVFYAVPADRDDAKRLAKNIADGMKPAGKACSLKLVRTGQAVQVHVTMFPPDPNLLKDDHVIQEWRQLSAELSRDVFQGAKVEICVCDEIFNLIKVIQ